VRILIICQVAGDLSTFRLSFRGNQRRYEVSLDEMQVIHIVEQPIDEG